MNELNLGTAFRNGVRLIRRLSFIATFCLVITKVVMAQVPADHLRHGVNLGRFKDGVFENDPKRCCKKDGTRDDFADLKKMGFDHVRIVLKPGKMFETDDKGNVSDIAASSRKVLDGVVENLLDQDLGVILTISLEDDDRFKDKLAALPNAPDKLVDPGFLDQLSQFWVKLSNQYSTLADQNHKSGLIFFETLNEPKIGDTLWAVVQAKLAKGIRDGAPQSTILATGDQGGHFKGLLAMPNLLTDPNTIYVFHYYEPYAFTHQGENWNGNYAQLLTKGGSQVRYPYTSESGEGAAANVPNLIERSYVFYDMLLATRERIQADVNVIAEWRRRQSIAASHNVTVICDEFGVIKANPKPQDRALWLKDVRDALESQQIGWTVWDYSSDSFGLLNSADEFDDGVIGALNLKRP